MGGFFLLVSAIKETFNIIIILKTSSLKFCL